MKPLSTTGWGGVFLDKERFLDEITDQISYKPCALPSATN